MEILIYVVLFIIITSLPEILAKSKKKKKEYKYPDFDDEVSSTKDSGQIIIKKEDTLSTSEEVYFDLEDFFKKEYQKKVKVQEPKPQITDTQKKYMEYIDKAPKEEVVQESNVIPQTLVAKNQFSRDDFIKGFVFSEIIMKPRAYRPFRGPNT
ncbi:hypothetical protein LJC10_04235 [Selenomonadales bacterium OttesenSCG-928-I06]|nr:hypothetical protein [Selenomonadales bacterium OttesenSCG-928-I06]